MMELLINGETVEFLPGDTVITEEGDYLVISAEGFDLSDEGSEAHHILVDVKNGVMEGYLHNLNELWEFYKIKGVKRNHNSLARFMQGIKERENDRTMHKRKV